MAKARKKDEHPSLPLEAPAPVHKPPPPQVGDRVTIPRSEHKWKITSVRNEGRLVNLELPGTYLTRFGVDTAMVTFVDRVAPKAPEPAYDTSAILERIATIQRESLQRLDDDIAILTKHLKTEGASKDVMDALDHPSNGHHASWQAALERIEELILTDGSH
jgi:hypothetical protein